MRALAQRNGAHSYRIVPGQKRKSQIIRPGSRVLDFPVSPDGRAPTEREARDNDDEDNPHVRSGERELFPPRPRVDYSPIRVLTISVACS